MVALFNAKMYEGQVGQPIEDPVDGEKEAEEEELVLRRFTQDLTELTYNLDSTWTLPSLK